MSARKPENSFIDGIHKYLPPKKLFHREKMNNPYSSGTADWWYSGDAGDLWVEYKYLSKLPIRSLILPALSALQLDWLNSRHDEGRKVAVIVGWPQGGVIYTDKHWCETLTRVNFETLTLSRKALGNFLIDTCQTRARSPP